MTDDRLVLQQMVVLCAGLVIGIAAAYVVSLLPIPYGGDVESARRLGLVSLTVLEGYSKTRDIVNYLSLIALPIGCAMLFWSLWVRGDRYVRLRLAFAGPEPVGGTIGRRHLIAVIAAVVLLSFNINYFFKPVSGWIFLGEEGINLFAANSILAGGVFSVDFSTGYGPMLIYPLALLMKLAGTTLLTDRIYTYLLNLTAYGIITIFFFRTMRSKAVFVLSVLLYFSVFHPFVSESPNTTYLRVALGLLSLLLAGRYLETRSNGYLWVGGFVAGQSLLFSQEVGICAVVALTAVLFIANLPQRSWRRFFAEMLRVVCACFVSLAPMLLYLAYKGALVSFLFELAYYPKLYAMGYSALKFPTLTTLFTAPIAGQALFPYWLIAIYLVAAIWLLPQLFLGKICSRTLIPVAVLIMGLLLFRSALCRSDFYHLFFAAQPAFVLFFLLLDRAVCSGGDERTPRSRRIVVISLFVLFYLALFLFPGFRKYIVMDFVKKGGDIRSKWSRNEVGFQFLGNRTGGVPIGEELVGSVTKIYNFLVRNTAPGEYVYFYPNEAGYYFLFDRKNPTRYAFSYQAITAEQRREIIRDLEARKPRFVVYSRNVWLIDDIPPEVQVPELHHYLSEHYLPHEDLGEILIMKRIES